MRVMIIFLLLCSPALGADGITVKYVGMEETDDCIEKSEWINVIDDEGRETYIVVSPCTEK